MSTRRTGAAAALLAELTARGVRLSLDDDGVRVRFEAPRGAMDVDLLRLLTCQRREIAALLAAAPEHGDPPPGVGAAKVARALARDLADG